MRDKSKCCHVVAASGDVVDFRAVDTTSFSTRGVINVWRIKITKRRPAMRRTLMLHVFHGPTLTSLTQSASCVGLSQLAYLCSWFDAYRMLARSSDPLGML